MNDARRKRIWEGGGRVLKGTKKGNNRETIGLWENGVAQGYFLIGWLL